jgi:hypothetical protein
MQTSNAATPVPAQASFDEPSLSRSASPQLVEGSRKRRYPATADDDMSFCPPKRAQTLGSQLSTPSPKFPLHRSGSPFTHLRRPTSVPGRQAARRWEEMSLLNQSLQPSDSSPRRATWPRMFDTTNDDDHTPRPLRTRTSEETRYSSRGPRFPYTAGGFVDLAFGHMRR